jgi:hypothetical protein
MRLRGITVPVEARRLVGIKFEATALGSVASWIVGIFFIRGLCFTAVGGVRC